jgi:hypothetical protein
VYWTRGKVKWSCDRILAESKYFYCSRSRHVVFYIVQRIAGTKAAYFSKIYYHTQFIYHILNGDSVAPTSQVRASAMLVILIARNNKYESGVASNGITFMSNVIKIRPEVLEFRSVADGWTDRHDNPYMRSYRAKNA